MTLTVDELDAMPEGTVVRDANGQVWERATVGAHNDLGWFLLEHTIGYRSLEIGDGAQVLTSDQHVESEDDPERSTEPCKAEIHSWERFNPIQMDSYWIRCTLYGRHDEHEDSNTGLRWRDKG